MQVGDTPNISNRRFFVSISILLVFTRFVNSYLKFNERFKKINIFTMKLWSDRSIKYSAFITAQAASPHAVYRPRETLRS